METPGFLPAWSLPQPQPTPSMEAQSQLEGSMLTPSPPAPRQALCRLWGQEDSCRCAQPGQLPGTTSHTARRTFGDRCLKVAVLTTSAGSSGQRRGSRSREASGEQDNARVSLGAVSPLLVGCGSGSVWSWGCRAAPPASGGHPHPGAELVSSSVSSAVAQRLPSLGGEGSFHLLL